MEVASVLHMKGGNGQTSYAKNSSIQNVVLSLTKVMKQATAVEFYCTYLPETLNIAELGCSSGPNALVVASDIIEAIKQRCDLLGRPMPNFQLLLNDLPMNDFNCIFSLLPDLYNRWGLNPVQGNDSGRCYVYGVPGSFYGRLFPNQSLHIVHSSMGLHWLSQVPKLVDRSNMPLNIGNVYISKTSHPCVQDAYLMQFERDFSLFFNCRSEEMVIGGRMILTFLGRRNLDPATEENCYQWELLAEALRDMASEGLVNQEEVDSFNIPFYAPSPNELINIITRMRSFEICNIDTFETNLEATEQYQCDDLIDENKKTTSAACLANTMRAALESMLASHFGEEIMKELFERYHNLLEGYYSRNRAILICTIISLVKKS